MNDDSAGEVFNAHHRQDAVWMPRPVRQRRVDENRKQRHEHEESRKMNAFCKRPGNQRGRDNREFHLEQSVKNQRNRQRQPANSVRADSNAFKHEKRSRVADDSVKVRPEREAERNDNPQDADKSNANDAL